LTYKGKDKYRTFIGGLGTTISGFLIFSYGLVGFLDLLDQKVEHINFSEMYNDVNDGNPINPKETGFNFSFGFMSDSLPAGIGTYFINKRTKIGKGPGGEQNPVDLNMDYC
jgi:hypothetical protein